MENNFAWDCCMATFNSEWEVGKDKVLGLFCSEQHGSTNDLPRDQPQHSPEERFGFGHGCWLWTSVTIGQRHGKYCCNNSTCGLT